MKMLINATQLNGKDCALFPDRWASFAHYKLDIESRGTAEKADVSASDVGKSPASSSRTES